MRHRIALALLVLTGLAVSGLRAADWPQWRGPHFNGSSDATGLPETLDDQHQLWAVTLPGHGAGTPVVWGDNIFLSCLDSQSKKLLGMCLSRKDGRVLWQKEVGIGFK